MYEHESHNRITIKIFCSCSSAL